MEFRCRCNVCGKIYCYTDQDLKDNAKNAGLSALSALGTMASVFGGTKIDAYAQNSMSDRYGSKVVDYSRCPSCNSSDISMLSDEEWSKYQSNGGNGFQAKKIDINSNASVESLLKRTKMFLEEEDWESADAYCEHILDADPECAMVYVYKLMIDLKVAEQDKLADLNESFEDNKMYQKAIKFADAPLKELLEGYVSTIVNRNRENDYIAAVSTFESAITEEDYLSIIPSFEVLDGYKDSDELIIQCKEKAEIARKDYIYNNAVNKMDSVTIETVEQAVVEFEKIPGWKDSENRKAEAIEKLKLLKQNKKSEEKVKHNNRKKATMFISVVVIIASIVLTYVCYIVPNRHYKIINSYIISEDYDAAFDEMNILMSMFGGTNFYNRAQKKLYSTAESLRNEEKYDEAMGIFEKLGDYSNSRNLYLDCKRTLDAYKAKEAVELSSEREAEKQKQLDYILELVSGTNGGFDKYNWYLLGNEDNTAILMCRDVVLETNYSMLFEKTGKVYNEILENNFSEEERTHIKEIRLPKLEELTEAGLPSRTFAEVNGYGYVEMDDREGIANFLVRPVVVVETNEVFADNDKKQTLKEDVNLTELDQISAEEVTDEYLYSEAREWMKKGFINKASAYLELLESEYEDSNNMIEICEKYKQFCGKWNDNVFNIDIYCKIDLDTNENTFLVRLPVATESGLVSIHAKEISDKELIANDSVEILSNGISKDLSVNFDFLMDNEMTADYKIETAGYTYALSNKRGKLNKVEDY